MLSLSLWRFSLTFEFSAVNNSVLASTGVVSRVCAIGVDCYTDRASEPTDPAKRKPTFKLSALRGSSVPFRARREKCCVLTARGRAGRSCGARADITDKSEYYLYTKQYKQAPDACVCISRHPCTASLL
jgi:hypothetical protein